jgi:hypothetical protein
MALTPARIVGSGTGQNRAECSEGSGTPVFFAVGDAVEVNRTNHKHEGRNLVTLEAELAEVLAAHHRRFFDNVVGAEASLQCRYLTLC